MRIALLHYSAPPVIGGVESVIREHARLLRGAGHQVVIICGRGAGEIVLNEIAETETPTPQVRAALQPWLARQEFVLVHNVLTTTFHPHLAQAVCEIADALPQVRFVAWIHDLPARPEELPRLHPRIEYVTISEHRQHQWQALTGADAAVIPNGIDALETLALSPEVRAFSREHRVLEREFVFLQPARLVRRKNVELTLHVAAALRAAGCDALFLITAAADPHTPTAPAYADSLRALRAALDLESCVHFLHDFFPISDRDLHGLFAVADALFLPSTDEGFAVPILEATLHRLPIFCQDRAPMNALLAAPPHTFSPQDSAEEVAAFITRTLTADPRTQARKETIRRYSWDSIFQQHLAPLLTPARHETLHAFSHDQ